MAFKTDNSDGSRRKPTGVQLTIRVTLKVVNAESEDWYPWGATLGLKGEIKPDRANHPPGF